MKSLAVVLGALMVVFASAPSAQAQTFIPAGCYNVTTTVNGTTYTGCATPSPTPTAKPTLAPTPRPTPTPTASPVASAPYGPTSPWNRKISANPTIASYSASVIAQEFASGNTQIVRNDEAGAGDYAHPLYFATASDPIVHTVCNQYCPSTPVGDIHMPAKARPAGGTDAHMAVVQPDGTEIDFWALYGSPGSDTTWDAPHNAQTRDWQTGDTATAGNVSACGSYASGSGNIAAANLPGATAGEACLGAGIINAADLQAGAIHHALYLVLQCAIGSQYPAPTGATTDQCTSGVGPPIGGRLWYDVPDATTNANTGLRPWEKAILNALHDYGGYLEDDFSGGASVSGMSFMPASGEQTYAYGLANPFAALTAAPNNWTLMSIATLATYGLTVQEPRYTGADPWQPAGVDFAAHMHWLAPCSAQGAC